MYKHIQLVECIFSHEIPRDSGQVSTHLRHLPAYKYLSTPENVYILGEYTHSIYLSVVVITNL
jgi:hypothetical protein